MRRNQRLRYEMFVRVRNFGTTNRDVFPESTPAAQRFAQLATVVTTIEEHLVRRDQARADARKVKIATRRTAIEGMKAIAATGREAALDETDPHPFRMPDRSASTIVLTSARLFKEEAERRKEKFVELGMPLTFLEDFGTAVNNLAAAVGVQQDSRGAREKAQAGLKAGLVRGMRLVSQLDVTVANALRLDPERLGQWHGARRIVPRSSSGGATATPAPAPVPAPAVTPPAAPPVATLPSPPSVVVTPSPTDTPEEVLKIAS